MSATGARSAVGAATRAHVLAGALRWLGALGIVSVAVARCVIVFAPQVVFDVDPALDAAPLAGLGPAGSLFLDALLLMACGGALVGETLARRGIEWPLLALALVPAPAIAWHGFNDAGDLWRGSTWLAAAIACATAAHLGRDRSIRLAMVSLLAAVLVPVLMRGALQSAITIDGWSLRGPEHEQTIVEFQKHRDEFYRDRGWEKDSASVRLYEERLKQPDPRGWFPTTNLFASMVAWGLVLCIGLVAGAVKDRLGARWVVPLAGGAVASIAGLLASGSKGAALAAAAGLAMLAAPWCARGRWRSLLARRGGALALLLVAGALAGVAVRGMLGESWLGERSLLFRWHYLVGSAHVVARHGLIGVGPDGFQAAYVEARPAHSPEEVTSAHNMSADWLADLGLAGIAWMALAGILLWRAGQGGQQSGGGGGGYVPARRILFAAAAVALVALAPAVLVEYDAVDTPIKEMARSAGLLGFVLAAVLINGVLERSRQSLADWTIAAAATALLVHAQIEMTFFDPGTVTWMMCVLGLAGGAAMRPPRPVAGAVASALLLGAAAALSLGWAARAARAQSLMEEAAKGIASARGVQQQTWARQEAAGLLESAWLEQMPTDTALLEQSARQLLIAAQLAGQDSRIQLAGDAADRAREAASAGRGARPSGLGLLAEALRFRAALSAEPGDWQEAIEAARRMTAIDPQGIAAWRTLGDVLWESARPAEAAAAYERALRNEDNFALDPMRQLSTRERGVLQERIAEAQRGGAER